VTPLPRTGSLEPGAGPPGRPLFRSSKEISMKLSYVVLAAAAALTVVQVTGCAVARDQQTVGSYIDDATLTTRVKASFAKDPTVAATSINVETLKGTVQLSGFAKSAAERSTAERLARETEGVKTVRNDIVVR
jgi:hyperosmotically inducible protein